MSILHSYNPVEFFKAWFAAQYDAATARDLADFEAMLEADAATPVLNGSPEHFQQVVRAHIVSPWGHCRCGAGVGPRDYRKHIADVWAPHALPEGW